MGLEGEGEGDGTTDGRFCNPSHPFEGWITCADVYVCLPHQRNLSPSNKMTRDELIERVKANLKTT